MMFSRHPRDPRVVHVPASVVRTPADLLSRTSAAHAHAEPIAQEDDLTPRAMVLLGLGVATTSLSIASVLVAAALRALK